ncbi:hypothetical protein O3G_MSEX008787 [Manduca sexta]|uniref:Uncharacterized protein n=1 Tax=Manduca sexta TaxID=7130 RepID=A0A921ZD65_MANSE|nr:hypothetical protein O3G_MSEX008787 [Manduca sexta]
MSYKNNCRTCLNSEKEMRNINSTILIGGEDIKLSDILQIFYNYQFTDDPNLPENICINCVHQLTITYSFKLLINTSMKTLTENLNQVDSNSENYECHLESEEKNKSEKVLQQCDQCGKSYPPGYIRIHMLTHGNDRPYSCKYCPKKFKVPGGLHSHILWNHKRTRNHKCEVCNATFISSSSRSSHIRKNHLKEKKYRCDNCGKRFFSKSELQRHSLTHTGVKNFHCHLCDKSYQTRYGLNVHLRSHSQITMNVLNL